MELTQNQIKLLKQLNEMLIALDSALRKSLAAAYNAYTTIHPINANEPAQRREHA